MLRENKFLTSRGLRDCGLGQKGLCEVSCALVMSTTLVYQGTRLINKACLGRLVICSIVYVVMVLGDCSMMVALVQCYVWHNWHCVGLVGKVHVADVYLLSTTADQQPNIGKPGVERVWSG